MDDGGRYRLGAVRLGADFSSAPRWDDAVRVGRRLGMSAALVSLVLIGVLVGGVAVVAVYQTDGAAPPFLGTSTPSPAEDAPTACFAFAGGDLGIAPGGEALAQAAERASLPSFVALSPGVQVLPSTTTPGTFELIARVCGGSLSRNELIAAGTAIAAAIYADPSHVRLSVLVISPWTAMGSSAIAADPSGVAISSDYPAHRWDAPPSELQTAWGSS